MVYEPLTLSQGAFLKLANSPYCSSIAWIIQHLPPLQKKRILYIPIHTSPSMVNVQRSIPFCSSGSELQEANPFFFPVAPDQISWATHLGRVAVLIAKNFRTWVWLIWNVRYQCLMLNIIFNIKNEFNCKTYTCIMHEKNTYKSWFQKSRIDSLSGINSKDWIGMKFEAFHHQHFVPSLGANHRKYIGTLKFHELLLTTCLLGKCQCQMNSKNHHVRIFPGCFDFKRAKRSNFYKTFPAHFHTEYLPVNRHKFPPYKCVTGVIKSY